MGKLVPLAQNAGGALGRKVAGEADGRASQVDAFREKAAWGRGQKAFPVLPLPPLAASR